MMLLLMTMMIIIMLTHWQWRRMLQREAKLLKDMNMTSVVAVGLGADVGRSELSLIASYPHELNVIMSPGFSNLTATSAESDIMRAICGKRYLMQIQYG